VGVGIDHGRLEPSESISGEIGDHVVDLLRISNERRRAIIKIEDALKKEGTEFLGVLSIESLGVPYAGPSFVPRGTLLLLLVLIEHPSKATAYGRRHGPEEISRVIPVEVFPTGRRRFGISVISATTTSVSAIPIPTSAITASIAPIVIVVASVTWIIRWVPWYVPRSTVLIPEWIGMMPRAIFPRTTGSPGTWRRRPIEIQRAGLTPMSMCMRSRIINVNKRRGRSMM
jgi:hypothetical protein